MKNAEKLFLEHQHIAEYYAKKVFNQEYLGFEKEDLEQEFRIKLYEVILSYEASIIRRQKRGMIRPVPLVIYLKASMSNYLKDTIKKISDQKETFSISSIESEKDHAFYSDDTSFIDVDNNEFIINGFNLTGNLHGIEKSVFNMFIKGKSVSEITKSLGSRINVGEVVNSQRKFLKANIHQFQPDNRQEYFVNHYVED